jgi:hypothetical protein
LKHNQTQKEDAMTARKQICCAAGLCASMAMLLAITNHHQRADTHKLPPARHAAAAVSVLTAIKPRSSATVFDPVLDYSTFLGGQSLGTGGAGLSGKGSILQGVTTLLVGSAGNAD